jgi:hypothetical protein
MKIQSIRLDEEENPDLIVMEMTADEAAFIARLAGSLSPRDVIDALDEDPRWFNASAEIYHGLAGSVFNRFYDDGIDAVIPKWKGRLKT